VVYSRRATRQNSALSVAKVDVAVVVIYLSVET